MNLFVRHDDTVRKKESIVIKDLKDLNLKDVVTFRLWQRNEVADI